MSTSGSGKRDRKSIPPDGSRSTIVEDPDGGVRQSGLFGEGHEPRIVHASNIPGGDRATQSQTTKSQTTRSAISEERLDFHFNYPTRRRTGTGDLSEAEASGGAALTHVKTATSDRSVHFAPGTESTPSGAKHSSPPRTGSATTYTPFPPSYATERRGLGSKSQASVSAPESQGDLETTSKPERDTTDSTVVESQAGISKAGGHSSKFWKNSLERLKRLVLRTRGVQPQSASKGDDGCRHNMTPSSERGQGGKFRGMLRDLTGTSSKGKAKADGDDPADKYSTPPGLQPVTLGKKPDGSTRALPYAAGPDRTKPFERCEPPVSSSETATSAPEASTRDPGRDGTTASRGPETSFLLDPDDSDVTD